MVNDAVGTKTVADFPLFIDGNSVSSDDARQSEHKDIAHPITAECRDYIQKKVLEAYQKEKGSTPAAPAASRPSTKAVIDEDTDIEL